MVQLLLEKRANIEAKDDHGNTALRMADNNSHMMVMQLLLDKGAKALTVLESTARVGRK